LTSSVRPPQRSGITVAVCLSVARSTASTSPSRRRPLRPDLAACGNAHSTAWRGAGGGGRRRASSTLTPRSRRAPDERGSGRSARRAGTHFLFSFARSTLQSLTTARHQSSQR
jgi:hypothetical protein